MRLAIKTLLYVYPKDRDKRDAFNMGVFRKVGILASTDRLYDTIHRNRLS